MKFIYARKRHHNAQLTLPVLLVSALVGCNTNSPTPVTTPPTNTNASVQQLLDKAHSSTLDMRAPYLLDAAALALQSNQSQTAEQTLSELEALKLNTAQRARDRLLSARLALQKNKPEQALNFLQDRELLQTLDQLSTADQIDVSLMRAQALYATGKYFASAQERVFVEPLLSDAQVEQNHDAIRRALSRLNAAELESFRAKSRSEPMRGWLDLAIAIAAKQNRDGGALQTNTTTAGFAQTTADTATMSSIPAEPIKQVALLLPLSGKLAAFGEAVRDGFFAALYRAHQHGEAVPSVRVYDSDSAGIVALYQQAVTDGAAVVIGPLEKLQVDQFYSQPLPAPLLALNRADIAQAPPANLYQFSLAPEDETAQLADLISQDNRHNVLIIAAEEDARTHEMEAFQQRWQSIGGNTSSTAFYRNQQDLSVAIRSALNIPRSEARGREMENLLNRNIEFSPHRRRDIDAVFMLAKPTQARSIKPLLNFYYAGDLPVYSTSRIYSGFPSGALDRDLEKVRFTEMPWVLQQSPLKQQILATQPSARNYLRLYALGIDSFDLCSRLHALETGGARRIAGQTGALLLNSQRVVERKLLLAEMRNGAAVQNGNGNIDDNGTDAKEGGDVETDKANH